MGRPSGNWKLAVLPVMMAALMAACGGGDGGGSGDSGPPAGGSETGGNGGGNGGGDNGGGDGGSQPGATALSYRYETVASVGDSAAFTQLLNDKGANGWRYNSPVLFGTDVSSGMSELFVKDVETTYQYRLLASPAAADGTLAQLNEQGQQGYRYVGPLMVSGAAVTNLYARTQSNPGNYSYRILSATSDRPTLLEQANQQGGEGYWLVSGMVFDNGTTQRNLYMTDASQPTARYHYRALDTQGTRQAFVDQLNAQGSEGYRYKGPDADAGSLYVRDTTQNARFAYQIEDPQATAGAFVERSNALGAEGSALIGTDMLGTIYAKPSQCSGFLCTVLHPLTQN